MSRYQIIRPGDIVISFDHKADAEAFIEHFELEDAYVFDQGDDYEEAS